VKEIRKKKKKKKKKKKRKKKKKKKKKKKLLFKYCLMSGFALCISNIRTLPIDKFI